MDNDKIIWKFTGSQNIKTLKQMKELIELRKMVGKNEDLCEGVAEKKEIKRTMKSSIQGKWQKLMDNSGLTDKVQEIIP